MKSDNQSKPFVFYSDKLNFKSKEGLKGKEYWVEGYISTGDMDLVNDVVTKSCMSSMLSQFDGRSIKLDFEHEAFRGDDPISTEAAKTRLPLGKAVDKRIDEKGVTVKWKMNPNWKKFDQSGNVVMTFKDIWSNVEEGFYDAFSIAYVPTRTQNVTKEGKTVRMLDDVHLLNVALTGNPINPAAKMGAVMAKSLEFMNQKGNEEIDMETIEVKGRLDKIESTLQEIKSNLSDNNVDNKTQGCKSMTENKDENPEAEVEAEAQDSAPAEPSQEQPAEGEQKAEKKPEEEEEDEDKEDDKKEAKSMTLTEMKSIVETLSKEMKDLKKENADLKAIVEKPLQKSKGAESNELKSQGNQEEVKSLGPLDLMR